MRVMQNTQNVDGHKIYEICNVLCTGDKQVAEKSPEKDEFCYALAWYLTKYH